jgi:hypothetical protein
VRRSTLPPNLSPSEFMAAARRRRRRRRRRRSRRS